MAMFIPQIRKEEIKQSIGYIRKLIQNVPEENKNRPELKKPVANMFAISLTEGWRGEICHCAITDDNGDLLHYKIKDPSFHNWLALALAVRNNEISDFLFVIKVLTYRIAGMTYNLKMCQFENLNIKNVWNYKDNSIFKFIHSQIFKLKKYVK